MLLYLELVIVELHRVANTHETQKKQYIKVDPSNGDIFDIDMLCICMLSATPMVDRRNIFCGNPTQVEAISTVRSSQNSRIVLVPWREAFSSNVYIN